MTIGGSIALIAIGAILAFAVNLSTTAFDIDVIGFILMGAGLLGLIFGLTQVRGRPDTTVVEERRPLVEERRIIDERDPRY